MSRIAKRGQTAAHLRYITRPSAAREVIRERLDHWSYARQAQAAEEEAERRRGRVCERFIVALPVEASRDQRLELARAFAEVLTKGKAGYVLAIHDKVGNDEGNPHFHLVAFDKQEKSGGRGRPRSLLGMARKNAVETWAKRWADIHNEMMAAWGFGSASEITHLSFEARDIDRIPQIHEGPASRAMRDRGERGTSKMEWKPVDAGRNRAEANSIIRQINQLNEESKNDTGNRLGGTNRRDPEQGHSRRPSFGKDCQRRGQMPFGNVESKENPFRPCQEPSRNQDPPWIAGACPESSGGTSRSRQSYKDQRHSPSACKRPIRPPVGRRRVKRLFLELILLRDTLRARLLAKKRQRAGTSSIPEEAGDRGLGYNKTGKSQLKRRDTRLI